MLTVFGPKSSLGKRIVCHKRYTLHNVSENTQGYHAINNHIYIHMSRIHNLEIVTGNTVARTCQKLLILGLLFSSLLVNERCSTVASAKVRLLAYSSSSFVLR